jgi:hypothetical protein
MEKLLVVCPHAQHFDGAHIVEHFIDETVLAVNPARISGTQVAQQLFEGRVTLEWVTRQNF